MKPFNEIIDHHIDPSDVRQQFETFQIKLHCCRYWKFHNWNVRNLSAPFWRFYHNELPGAFVELEGRLYELNKDQSLLIPPNTPYSILTSGNNSDLNKIDGSRITSMDEIHHHEPDTFDHLFIHFNLGINRDDCEPGIYKIPVTDQLRKNITTIRHHLLKDHVSIPVHITTKIYNVIMESVASLPQKSWILTHYDERIDDTLAFIETHLHRNIQNEELAQKVNLVTNSFARLFRENVGLSVQKYIQKKRIEKALTLLHHSTFTIEQIARECGFYDLHHFSRVFKQELNMPPTYYRKNMSIA
ncbi:helix-turn-helix domain-containing protein [Saccharicrinis sp. FJH62]|uniref:helix-turn-helix domain-containing protein n=1 Tax=Saccharicrinis sp. FJH62 TaxID=3344657 RepID=UPI0035D50E5D